MDTELLIATGNTYREQRQPELALSYYAQAMMQDSQSVSALNNYGNVIREIGYPDRAIPFLKRAIELDPGHETARFNLAVSLLLQGNYKDGWAAYEDRWNFEHLRGALPVLPRPRWTGQDLTGKTILVIGEQGIGDTVQFSRFAVNLQQLGAQVVFAVSDNMISLFGSNDIIKQTVGFGNNLPDFDFWTPAMSIPGFLGITLDNLSSPLSYINPNQTTVSQWAARLGIKKRLRIGFSWTGRRDTWINQHKSVPFELIADMIKKNPNYDWINLQVDATESENQMLESIGCATYPGTISCMSDTAGLIACMDVVVSVDTAISHLSGAIGKPTWIMLNQYAQDWRWLLRRSDSPWYPSVRLFRQPNMDNWKPVLDTISHHLNLFKI